MSSRHPVELPYSFSLQPELLSGTLRQNIDPFQQYDDAVLNDALRSAGLFSLQNDLEDEEAILREMKEYGDMGLGLEMDNAGPPSDIDPSNPSRNAWASSVPQHDSGPPPPSGAVCESPTEKRTVPAVMMGKPSVKEIA